MAKSHYRIEEVAAVTGLSKRALRYYEEVELLVPEERSPGGYRLYSETDVARLQHIVTLRDALGYTLDEMKEVLTAEDELAQIRAAFQAGGNPADLISSAERALLILQREEERAARKLEQIAVVRDRYHERVQKAIDRIADLKSKI